MPTYTYTRVLYTLYEFVRVCMRVSLYVCLCVCMLVGSWYVRMREYLWVCGMYVDVCGCVLMCLDMCGCVCLCADVCVCDRYT